MAGLSRTAISRPSSSREPAFRSFSACAASAKCQGSRRPQHPHDIRGSPRGSPIRRRHRADGYQRYKWRGTDPTHYDNVALRRAMELNKPLIWFSAWAQASTCPCFRSGLWRGTEEHQFVVAVEEDMREQWSDRFSIRPTSHCAASTSMPRSSDGFTSRLPRQSTARVRGRLRALPLASSRASGRGAHSRGRGWRWPVVPNGVAMCAIHHRAFDADVLGIRPDYVVQVRQDVLEEQDGPTLRHALQAIHGEKLLLPRQRAARPNPELSRGAIRAIPKGGLGPPLRLEESGQVPVRSQPDALGRCL